MSLALLNRQPITWDNEAASYLTSVESVDSQSLELTVARAINTFVIDCKIRGIWGAIKSSCLLCGARTLSGALVPLKGVAPTSNDFVSADYNRKTGLKGNGSNKYLNSNRNNDSDPQNNFHLAVCIGGASADIADQVYVYAGGGGFGTGSSNLVRNTSSGINARCRSSTSNSVYTTSIKLLDNSLYGISRSLNTGYSARANFVNLTVSQASDSASTGNIFIFARGSTTNTPDAYCPARLSFYSIGESLDLRLLDQCLTKYINTLNAIL